MPGTFSPSSRPRRPGAYFNFVQTERPFILPSQGSIVALAFTHDWGPFEVVQRVASLDEFIALYGESTDTDGYRAVRQAFRGEGVNDRGGASQVVCYRFGGSTALKGTVTLQNITPAAGVVLTARYEGSFANDLSIIVRASTAGRQEMVVAQGTTELEVFDHAETDLAGLASDINAFSDYFTATVTTNGVKLNAGTFPVASGNDGGTLAAADFTAALAALEIERFGVFAFGGFDPSATYSTTPGATILTSIVQWVKDHNAAGKRFMAVIGGGIAESAQTANTRSTSINDPNVVNIGVGTIVDDTLGDLSTAQFAPRVAGAIAHRGEGSSITFARFAGIDVTGGVTDAQIETSFDAGTVVLTRDSFTPAPVRIEKGLTTFSTTTDADRPYTIYSVPKFVRTMHGLEMELTEYAEQNVIGQLPVNERTRTLLVAEMTSRLRSREERGVLQPGSVVSVTGSDDDQDYIDLQYTIKFGRSLEQVFNTVRIG